MHTLQLKVDDAIFETFMGMIKRFPQDKITIIDTNDTDMVSLEEAKSKVQNALNQISQKRGLALEDAFDKVLNR